MSERRFWHSRVALGIAAASFYGRSAAEAVKDKAESPAAVFRILIDTTFLKPRQRPDHNYINKFHEEGQRAAWLLR